MLKNQEMLCLHFFHHMMRIAQFMSVRPEVGARQLGRGRMLECALKNMKQTLALRQQENTHL